MDLDRYTEALRAQLAAAAEIGGEETRTLAEKLSVSLESAARLALMEALSDAASEISRELAPGSVDVHLRGRELELIVSAAPTTEFAELSHAPAQPIAESSEPDDSSISRTTLRLPENLKSRIERAATEAGVSLNSWLVHTITTAVEAPERHGTARGSRTGDNFTGWAR